MVRADPARRRPSRGRRGRRRRRSARRRRTRSGQGGEFPSRGHLLLTDACATRTGRLSESSHAIVLARVAGLAGLQSRCGTARTTDLVAEFGRRLVRVQVEDATSVSATAAGTSASAPAAATKAGAGLPRVLDPHRCRLPLRAGRRRPALVHPVGRTSAVARALRSGGPKYAEFEVERGRSDSRTARRATRLYNRLLDRSGGCPSG